MNRHHQGSLLSLKGLNVVPQFQIHGHQAQAAQRRMFFHHSSSQWQSIIDLPMELIIDSVSISLPVFFFFLLPLSPLLSEGKSTQLQVTGKESCLTENLQIGNNQVFPNQKKTNIFFLTNEGDWMEFLPHSQWLLQLKSTFTTNQANCCIGWSV